MPEVIYDRTFYVDSGRIEGRAVIVDHSCPERVEFRFGITEQGAVTYHDSRVEPCMGIPNDVRRTVWCSLYQQARADLDREIRIATDPHYDLPDREIY